MATDSNPSPTGEDRVDDLLSYTGTRLLVVLIIAGVTIALYYDSSFSRENVRLLLYVALAFATTDFVDVAAELLIAKLADTRLDTYLDLGRHVRVVNVVVALVSAVLVIFVTFGVSQWSTTTQYHAMLGVLVLSLIAYVRLANSKRNSNRPPTPTLYRRDRSERSGAPNFIGPLILAFLLFTAVIIAYFGLLYTIAP